ncbi:MAG: cell division protein ZapA [Clostridia bacterium]|nr:cell division protein ZapA [Clostridia bacterium]
MEKQTRTTVKIMGREYAIKAAESEEYIHKVAINVNNTMQKIADKNQKLSTSMINVLTAINIADQLLKTQQELEQLQNKYESACKEIDDLKGRLKEINNKIIKSSVDAKKYKKDFYGKLLDINK